MAWSKSHEDCCIWLGGQAQRTKETLVSARQERRRVISAWESPKSRRAPREVLTFQPSLKDFLTEIRWSNGAAKEGEAPSCDGNVGW